MKLFSEYLVEAMIDDHEYVSVEEAKQRAAAKRAIKNNPNPTEAQQLAAVSVDGYQIKTLLANGVHLSDKVIYAALANNGYCIKNVPNPTEDMKIAAIKQQPKAIIFIKKPSDTVKQTYLDMVPNGISRIKNPTEAQQLAAVSVDGYVILHNINVGKRNPISSKVLAAALSEPNFITGKTSYSPNGNIHRQKQYDDFVKHTFANNTVLMNKWLRYAKNVREIG
jgi:hypothetical protein